MSQPITFKVSAKASSGTQEAWKSSYKEKDLVCSIPKEFQGPGEGFGPGSLFGISLLTCLIAMFKVYIQREKLSFKSLEATAEVVMDKDPKLKKMVVAKILIFVHIMGSSDKEKVRKILGLAIADCAISNSILSEKIFTSKVE